MQVVSLHSSVLRELFLSQRGAEPVSRLHAFKRFCPAKAGAGWLARSFPRSLAYSASQHHQHPPQVRLEAPWQGYTAREMAFFLWVLYRAGAPAALSALDFGAFGGALRGVLRLAHQLEVGPLVDAITQHLLARAEALGTPDLLPWVGLLEAMHLSAAWAGLVVQLARQLQHGREWQGLVGYKAFQLRDELSPAALAALLGCSVHAARIGAPPSAAQVASWLEGPATPTYCWRLKG